VSNSWQDTTLALAGIFQASALVAQLAKTGNVPSEAYHCSIESLFALNPPDTISIYGSVASLRLGLEQLRATLSSETTNNTPDAARIREVLRYSMAILHLQKKLSRRKDMLGVIGSRLQQAARQAEHFGATHENVVGNLGDLYQETLSTFPFRIQVAGDPGYLQQPRIASEVRALLLAGVRSATLWRQLGGNRWHLLLRRKQLAANVEQLLKQAKGDNVHHLH